jgi:small subunit ribosomal protein S5
MTTEENKKENKMDMNDTPKDNGEKVEVKAEDKKDKEVKERGNAGKKPFKKNFRKRTPFKREKPEFEQKILSLRRVTRVMAGGRRFSFSVAMVVGDKKGRVGFGMGKSNDTTLAIEKAVRNAKKNMVKITLKDGALPYDVSAKYKSSEVVIRPVTGKGLAAGGAVRTVLEFAGVKEAGAKILTRSKNHINNAKATIIALEPFSKKVEVSLAPADRTRRTFKPRRFSGRKPLGQKTDDKKEVKVEKK